MLFSNFSAQTKSSQNNINTKSTSKKCAPLTERFNTTENIKIFNKGIGS